MEEGDISTTNINSLWLNNIYENLKNLETMERLAREGCSTIIEYAQYTPELKKVIIADIQYKNLRLMVTEIDLLLTDLSPVIPDQTVNRFYQQLNTLKSYVLYRKLLVTDITSDSKKGIIESKVTPRFYTALDIVSLMRREIIKSIKHILYVPEEEVNKKKW